MQKNEFRGPLMQSAVVLGGILILFAIVASSGSNSAGGGILAIISGIGHLILFFIGMAIALPVSIILLIAIFLAAVAMVNPEQASQMYSDLKKNFSLNELLPIKQWCAAKQSETGISTEEYDRMQQEIAQLQDKNQILQKDIAEILQEKTLFRDNVSQLTEDNSALKERIAEMGVAIDHLQNSEQEIKDLVEKLTTKIEAGADQELKEQIKKLEELYGETHNKIETLVERLNSMESGLKQPAASSTSKKKRGKS